MLLGRKGELSEEKAAGKNLDLSKDPGDRMEEDGMDVVISAQRRNQLAC